MSIAPLVTRGIGAVVARPCNGTRLRDQEKGSGNSRRVARGKRAARPAPWSGECTGLVSAPPYHKVTGVAIASGGTGHGRIASVTSRT